MQGFIQLMKRHLKLYFRDRASVFFSLLSMIIVIVLMTFFLGDMSVESILRVMEQFPDRDLEADRENATLLILSWTYGGVIAINAVTVTLAVYSIMIKDRTSGRMNAFITSPLQRVFLAGSYIAAAWVASVLICVITLGITEGYGISRGMTAYTIGEHAELLLMIALNSFVYASLMYLVASFVKTEGAWSGIGTVVGTLVGFLGGIYIPIGNLSEGVGAILKSTPVLYASAMFRKVMTFRMMEETFAGMPDEVKESFAENVGIELFIGEHQMSMSEEWCILILCGIIFFVLSCLIEKVRAAVYENNH